MTGVELAVVPPVVVDAGPWVSGATYLTTYRVESTVFTSATLLPLLIVTFA
jgi:hypothetical protein